MRTSTLAASRLPPTLIGHHARAGQCPGPGHNRRCQHSCWNDKGTLLLLLSGFMCSTHCTATLTQLTDTTSSKPQPLAPTASLGIWPPGSVCGVILGGGENDSRRMFPLTEKRTLPAIPIGGQFRCACCMQARIDGHHDTAVCHIIIIITTTIIITVVIIAMRHMFISTVCHPI